MPRSNEGTTSVELVTPDMARGMLSSGPSGVEDNRPLSLRNVDAFVWDMVAAGSEKPVS